MIKIPFHKNYTTNLERLDDRTELPCAVCGKGIKFTNKRAKWVRTFYGVEIVSEQEASELLAQEEADPSQGYGDTGYFPVGADCLRKHPELLPYTVAYKIEDIEDAPATCSCGAEREGYRGDGPHHDRSCRQYASAATWAEVGTLTYFKSYA